jgi:F1F0 ATPase subunit 2
MELKCSSVVLLFPSIILAYFHSQYGMINLILTLMIAFAAGVTLGLSSLLALWHSLQTLSRHSYPVLWIVANTVLRLVLVTVILFAIMQFGEWRHLLASVVGFALARWLITRRLSQLNNLIFNRERSETAEKS